MPNHDQAFAKLGEVIRFWEEKYDDKFAGYSQPYKDRDSFNGLADFYASVAQFGGGAGAVGCDLGCWLGFPVYLESVAHKSKVYGIEIQETFTETAQEWAAEISARNISFAYMRDETVPLVSGTVDWVLVNQVLCNALPDSFENSINEAARILKPGGVLIISDSNNPYHEAVRERLKTTYFKAEVGDGTLQAPNGYNHRARRRFIAQAVPGLDDELLGDLATGTCYMHGRELIMVARHAAQNGVRPVSRFDPESELVPCNPANGAALGNRTNPYALGAIAENAGLSVTLNASLSRTAPEPDALYDHFQKSGSFFVIADKPE